MLRSTCEGELHRPEGVESSHAAWCARRTARCTCGWALAAAGAIRDAPSRAVLDPIVGSSCGNRKSPITRCADAVEQVLLVARRGCRATSPRRRPREPTRRIDTASRPFAVHHRRAPRRSTRSRVSRLSGLGVVVRSSSGIGSPIRWVDTLTMYVYPHVHRKHTPYVNGRRRGRRRRGEPGMKINPESLAKASSHHPWQDRRDLVPDPGRRRSRRARRCWARRSRPTSTSRTRPRPSRPSRSSSSASSQDESITETFVVAGASSGRGPGSRLRRAASTACLTGPAGRSVPTSSPRCPRRSRCRRAGGLNPQVAALGPIPSEDGKAVVFFTVYTGDIDQATEHFDEIDAVREAGVGRRHRGLHARSGQLVRGLQEDLRGGPAVR